MRRVLGLATVGALVFVGASKLSAQSLTSVPDNAAIFVKVKNLQDVSNKLGILFKQWGVSAMQPMLADPLASLEGMSNIQQGLKADGEAGFVFFNPMGLQDQREPYIIMVPVTDYAAFVKNFPDAQADGDMTVATMPMSQQQTYISKWGAFAAMSPNKALLAARPQATKPTGATGKQFTSRDVVAYINFNSFRNQAAMGLGMGRMAVMGQVDQQMNQQPDKAKYAPVAKAFLNQVFNGLDHFLNEATAVTIGMDLSDQGIQLTTMSEFAPDSYLGKLAAQWKTAPAMQAGGLVSGKYVFIGNTNLDATTLNQIVDDAAGPVITEAKNLGDQGKPFVEYVDAIKQFWQATKSQTVGVGVGTGKVGESPLFNLNMVVLGDAKGVIASQHKMASLQDVFSKMITMPGQPTSSMQVQDNAQTVDSVSFDRLTTTFASTNPNDPGTKVIDMVYGKGGFTMLMGQIDPQTVLITTERDDAAIKSAIQTAKNVNTPVAPTSPTGKVAARLPANASAEFFIYGDQSLAMASRASETFTGTPLQMKLPDNMDPIGMAMGTEGSATRMDLFVPSPLVQAIIQQVMVEAMHHQQKPAKAGNL